MTVWEATINKILLIGNVATNHQPYNQREEFTDEENLYQDARGSNISGGGHWDRDTDGCPF